MNSVRNSKNNKVNPIRKINSLALLREFVSSLRYRVKISNGVKRLLIFLAFIFSVAAFAIMFFDNNNYSFSFKEGKNILKAKVSAERIEENKTKELKNKIKEPKEKTKEDPQKETSLPEKYLLEVAFTSQAPAVYGDDGNQPLWDHDHGEACEEAAIITAHYFYIKENLTPQIADKQILKMLDFQEKNYSERNKDLESGETAKLAEDFYGYKNVRVLYDPTLEDIKKEIYTGNPVILPTAGRMLGNPNYTPPGPIYHMIVAIGWDDGTGQIITNDPGTRMGKSYVYNYDIFKKSLHEWNEGDVESGRSSMIVLN